MKDITLFIVDDVLNIIYNNKNIKTKMKDALSKGFILDKTKFMEEFLKVLKKEKIKGKLFGNNICVIKNSYMPVSELFMWENMLLEMGFLKVIFKDIKEYFKEKEATYIEINDTYMVVNLDKGIYIDLDYFKDIPKVTKCLNDNFKQYIYLFGYNKLIPKIKLLNTKIFYFEDYNDFIVNILLKVNKK